MPPSLHTRRLLAASALAAMGASAPLYAQTAADLPEARRLTRDAAIAYRSGDLAIFESRTDSASRLRPYHPALIYNLAAARALAGDTSASVRLLDRLADWGLAYDPGADEDFGALRGAASFARVRNRLLASVQPAGDAARAFELEDAEMLPEALAHDAATGAFFVGSVRHRSIVRIARDGTVSTFAGGTDDDMPAPLGMVIDPHRRLLWVAGSRVPESAAGSVEPADAQVRGYDLETGELRRWFDLPPAMMAGDVALDGLGGVLVSDWRSGALLRVAAGSDSIAVLLPPGTLGSPQGIAVIDGGRGAWIADYMLGLVFVDLSDGDTRVLAAPTTLLGSDALVRAGDDLIVVQNGIAPARVLRLVLAPDRSRVDDVEVLLSSHADFAEPTGAVLAGSSVFLVANGQWSRFSDGAIRDPETLARPVILEIVLPQNLRRAGAADGRRPGAD